jgi:hypothetical protein
MENSEPENKPEVKTISKAKRKKIERLLLDGKSATETAYLVGAKRDETKLVKSELQAEGKLDIGKVKNEIAKNLADFATIASRRLAAEVHTMPIGRLTLDAAIAIDKLRDLAETQQVTVEKRVIVTQDDINNILSVQTHITTTEKKPLDESQPPVV